MDVDADADTREEEGEAEEELQRTTATGADSAKEETVAEDPTEVGAEGAHRTREKTLLCI